MTVWDELNLIDPLSRLDMRKAQFEDYASDLTGRIIAARELVREGTVNAQQMIRVLKGDDQ